MWSDLPIDQKEEYKRMILAFTSLTEAFAQKAEDDDTTPSPIINSKYQETVFQRSFNATAEDIGNTSFDASLVYTNASGQIEKCMIGIKTFGIGSGQQKIAQFKANRDDWSVLIESLRRNAIGKTSKEEIDEINEEIYLELATRIARLRNIRIDSSEANLRGFIVSENDDSIKAVYHVLMPSRRNETPAIFVGETDYNRIDIDNITVLGCTGINNPTNFNFSDGQHTYRFTAADSQLLMDFNNNNIVQERWPVIYVDDAYAVFEDLADQLFGERHIAETDVIETVPPFVPESYSWKITNNSGEVELFSGFNMFYGTGSKLATASREDRIRRIHNRYENDTEYESLTPILDSVHSFLTERAGTMALKMQKVALRENIIDQLNELNNADFKADIMKLLFRPIGEMYIPIPNSVVFHTEHPDFFAPGTGNLIRTDDGKWKLPLPKEQNRFTLVFEPSGDEIEAFITQDAGKGIESCDRQSILGDWILHGLFRLAPYEPLTRRRLDELGINGIRLTKTLDNKIHISFIWIDDENPPADYRE